MYHQCRYIVNSCIINVSILKILVSLMKVYRKFMYHQCKYIENSSVINESIS